MKLWAHCDASGKIRSVTWVDAPEGVSLTLTPRPGEFVTEIHGHDLAAGVPSEKVLRDLVKNYTIADPLPRSILKKKL